MANVQNKSQNREIETDRFRVRGNLLEWENMMLQLSNISAVGIGDLPNVSFPNFAAVIGVVGAAICMMQGAGLFLGLALIIGAGWMIYNWYEENQARKNKKYLHLQMNSGDIYSLLFHDISFLQDTLKVVEQLLEDPDKYGDKVTVFDVRSGGITISNNKFTDLSSLNVIEGVE